MTLWLPFCSSLSHFIMINDNNNSFTCDQFLIGMWLHNCLLWLASHISHNNCHPLERVSCGGGVGRRAGWRHFHFKRNGTRAFPNWKGHNRLNNDKYDRHVELMGGVVVDDRTKNRRNCCQKIKLKYHSRLMHFWQDIHWLLDLKPRSNSFLNPKL